MADLDITITYGSATRSVTKADYSSAGLRPDAAGRAKLLEDIGVALNAIAADVGVYDSYVDMMVKAKSAMRSEDFAELVVSQPADLRAKLETSGLVTVATEAKA